MNRIYNTNAPGHVVEEVVVAEEVTTQSNTTTGQMCY